MKSDAIAIANYFVDKSNDSNKNITLLSLLKLVYIAHGFIMVLLKDDCGGFNPRFDKVEAWRYGPVVPSVYHSFKHNGSNPIKQKVMILSSADENDDNLLFTEPTITDENEKIVLDFVWNRYSKLSAGELVELTHAAATPWKHLYQPGMNIEIPYSMTKEYYTEVLKFLEEN